MEDNMPAADYVHGRSGRESERLDFQASRLADFLHDGTRYPAGSLVLEAACGVGAQTVILARNSPDASFTSIDISGESLAAAEARIRHEGLNGVRFQQADVCRLPFPPGSFDHVFVCFLLEHLVMPRKALQNLMGVLKPGGSITVIEGDHGSALFYPESVHARRAIQCLVDLQADIGGNALIGRELSHLLRETGFSDISVRPCTVYADPSVPESGDAVRGIFIAMVEGVREQALAKGMMTRDEWEKGIRDLVRTTKKDGSFIYTFFKATGRKLD